MSNVLRIEAHGASYAIEDPGGKIGEILRGGQPYEVKALEAMQRLEISPPAIAVDAGAGVGNHSLWLAAICGLEVYAFEPLDHRRLERNVRLNPGLEIRTFPVALGDFTGRTVVRGAPAHVIGEGYPAGGEVEVRRLDDFVDPHDRVRLIKIDVEGQEPEVLRGARAVIERDRPIIFAEAEDEPASARNAAELVPLGYRHDRTFGATPLEEWLPS